MARKARALVATPTVDSALEAGGQALSIALETGSMRTLHELQLAATRLQDIGSGKEIMGFVNSVEHAVREGRLS